MVIGFLSSQRFLVAWVTIMTATVVSAALSEGGLERNDEEGLDYSGRIPTFDGTLDDKAFHEYMQHLDEINKDILDRHDGLDVKEEEGFHCS